YRCVQGLLFGRLTAVGVELKNNPSTACAKGLTCNDARLPECRTTATGCVSSRNYAVLHGL
ncbi:hypothetical protein, partial [Pseudomonas viridiflava]|uniref:hypothetical protein n=1 Tax=Pseudomonas viridiflava TaxID=33069 RepID=UPI00198232ED